jgi:SAM-dependent methyltransferase
MSSFLKSIYSVRYTKHDERVKDVLWETLCEDFLQKYVCLTDTVVDIAAGHCEFINHIRCRTKYAFDLDSRIKKHAAKDVTVVVTDARRLPKNLTGKVDVVFMGCFLEHLPSKQAIVDVFNQVKMVLKSGGRLIILNPNIRFSTAEYWDYFDHLTPVSDRSVKEALLAMGYEIITYLPRFVPNTIKDSLPKSKFLVKLYLKLPFLFPIFGKQMFIVAKKP